MRIGAVACAVVLAAAAPAARAQSTKYPAAPVDKELERDQHSNLWDQALQPGSADYLVLVDEARASLERRTDAEIEIAIDKLTQAIARMPDRSEAYALRGHAYFLASVPAGDRTRKWAPCADDLSVAESRLANATCAVPNDETCVLDRYALRRELGLCLGRAGRYADAEHTFATLTASRPNDGEIWMRLGEVRIAMGKLEEAINALRTSLDRTADGAREGAAMWLLASAYDRRRQPDDAISAASSARVLDGSFVTIVNAEPPLLPGEADYLLALAYLLPVSQTGDAPSVAFEKPEYALAYLRRFIAGAPEGPWRKRADEHLHEIAAIKFPGYFSVVGVSANHEAAKPVVARAMPAMRACMAKMPSVVLSVRIVQNGPRSTDRPFLRLAPEGVTVPAQSVTMASAPQADLNAAAACVQRLAEGIALPPLKDKDSQRVTQFYVISP
jgi:tetratricopeptide (TPR) repeat protein